MMKFIKNCHVISQLQATYATELPINSQVQQQPQQVLGP